MTTSGGGTVIGALDDLAVVAEGRAGTRIAVGAPSLAT
jgi:hypothetical protein